MYVEESHCVTRGGTALEIRSAGEGDEFLLDCLFDRLTPEDLRFRFLSSIKHVGRRAIDHMTHGRAHESETFLAFDEATHRLVATAMVVWLPAARAEVAIAVASDRKGEGIGWQMLRFASEVAREGGASVIEAIESREHRAAIALEREMGFTVEPYPEDATLVRVSKVLAA